MNVENLGIEDLKPLVEWGVKLGKEVSDDFADKKISIAEGVALLDNFMQVPDLLSKKDAILAQAEDLSTDEANELIAAFDGVITKQDVIDTIHDSLNWLIATKNLIFRFKKAA